MRTASEMQRIAARRAARNRDSVVNCVLMPPLVRDRRHAREQRAEHQVVTARDRVVGVHEVDSLAAQEQGPRGHADQEEPSEVDSALDRAGEATAAPAGKPRGPMTRYDVHVKASVTESLHERHVAAEAHQQFEPLAIDALDEVQEAEVRPANRTVRVSLVIEDARTCGRIHAGSRTSTIRDAGDSFAPSVTDRLTRASRSRRRQSVTEPHDVWPRYEARQGRVLAPTASLFVDRGGGARAANRRAGIVQRSRRSLGPSETPGGPISEQLRVVSAPEDRVVEIKGA